MHPIILVMAGGAIGAAGRCEVGRLMLSRLGAYVPRGTLAIVGLARLRLALTRAAA